MAYWKEWKSLIGGGIGFVILGAIMVVLFLQPGVSSGYGPGGLDMMQIGLIFFIVGIAMLMLGILLKNKPESSQ